MRLIDTNGKEIYFIKRKITLLLAEYEIYKDNEIFAVVSQNFRFFKADLSIESKLGKFEVLGEFLSWEFEIRLDGNSFGYIQKEFLSWGDTYKLVIPDNTDAGFFVALVIAIDNCVHNGENN